MVSGKAVVVDGCQFGLSLNVMLWLHKDVTHLDIDGFGRELLMDYLRMRVRVWGGTEGDVGRLDCSGGEGVVQRGMLCWGVMELRRLLG